MQKLEDILHEKIAAIFNWADEHPEFDTDFIESLKAQLETQGQLSPKQIDALNNIIDKFNIE